MNNAIFGTFTRIFISVVVVEDSSKTNFSWRVTCQTQVVSPYAATPPNSLRACRALKERASNALRNHIMALVCIFFSIELIKPSHNEASR